MNPGKLGVHCQPDSVVASPEYARRLAEEAGVDCFILRTGYGLDFPQTMEKAVQIIRDLHISLSFLAGSWWGGTIQYVENLPSKSWESKYPMDLPGSAIDAEIVAKLRRLCTTFKPDSICMTHARYRHPGYIDGIFHEGNRDPEYLARMEAAGIPHSEVLTARRSWEKAMTVLDKAELLKASEKGLIECLCELSQSDALKRLTSFRCETVRQSMVTFRQVVTETGVSFGSNAYTPIAAEICGHDYEAVFADLCDFTQPLLPFMEYHRYEPLAAWARYVLQHTKMEEVDAVEIAKRLFRLGDAICPKDIQELDTCLEGDAQMIRSIVGTELRMCKPYLPKLDKIQPVFRGKNWDWATTDALMDEAKSLGIDSFAFMGCEYLLKGTSPVPADYSYLLTDPSPGDGWF